MKNRFLVLLTLVLSLTFTPVYAHHDGTAAEHTPGTPDATTAATPSFHEKIDQLLKSVPANHSFLVAPESRTANDLLLDIRSAEEFKKSPVKDALNVPLADLHDHLKELPRDKRVLVTSASIVDGAYAVFTLRLHGIDGWLIKKEEIGSGCPLAEANKKHHQ